MKIRFIESEMGLMLSFSDYVKTLRKINALSPKQSETIVWKALKIISKEFHSNIKKSVLIGHAVPIVIDIDNIWLHWAVFSQMEIFVLDSRKNIDFYKLQNAVDNPNEIRTNKNYFTKCAINIIEVAE